MKKQNFVTCFILFTFIILCNCTKEVDRRETSSVSVSKDVVNRNGIEYPVFSDSMLEFSNF
jgi:hypothetical protein